MKAQVVTALAVGCALAASAFASDPFTKGDKALSSAKKPMLLRVAKDGTQTLFKADSVNVTELTALKGKDDSDKAKETFMAKAIESVATDKNDVGPLAQLNAKDEVNATPANYGYYYGNYYYYNPYPTYIYYYQPVVYYTYYRWSYYNTGYTYVWYY